MAFQSNAFQNNAFQVDGVTPPVVVVTEVPGGSSRKKKRGKKPIYLSDLEAREAREWKIVPPPVQAPAAIPFDAEDEDEDDMLIQIIAAKVFH